MQTMHFLTRWAAVTGFTLITLLHTAAAQAEMVAVNGEDINMRSGPGAKNEALFKIGDGFPLEIVKTSGEWLQVKDFEGSVGWVLKKNVNNKPHMVVKANKGNDETINIRVEPNPKSKVVAQAKYGVVFKTAGKKGGWVNVEHEKGVKGWIESSLLWGF